MAIIQRLKVFGRHPGAKGNLTAIVDLPGNPEEAGVEVTVLIEPSERADVRLRFFYPGSLESPLCGHAVLAAASTLPGDLIEVETAAGVFPVRKDKDRVSVRLSAHQRCDEQLADQPEPVWFGLAAADMQVEGIYSAGKPKLCIRVADKARLDAASFDADRLKAWNEGKPFSGYVLYAVTDEAVFVRASNPLFNITENEACAVCCAAVPLSGHGGFRARMDRPEYDSEILIEPDPQGLWVGGRVFPA